METLAPPVGTKVKLRAFEEKDLPQVIAWRNDLEVRDGVLWPVETFSKVEAERWLKAVSDEKDLTRVTFAVTLASSGRLVGLTNLTRIDLAEGIGYFGVVIGEKDCWGQGLARESLELMLRHAAALKLRKVLLEVVSYNTRAIELYKRHGFATEGILKKQSFRNGSYHDLHIMSKFTEHI